MRSLIAPSCSLALAACAVLAHTACPKAQNDLKAASKLEDRLTDSLAFENGKVVEGEPPAAHDGDALYPQLSVLQVPPTIVPGMRFGVTFTVNHADLATVPYAVVYVRGSTKYIEVTATPNSDGTMVLRGMFNGDEQVAGQPFVVEFGALRTDKGAGNYLPWEIAVPATTWGCTEFCSFFDPVSCESVQPPVGGGTSCVASCETAMQGDSTCQGYWHDAVGCAQQYAAMACYEAAMFCQAPMALTPPQGCPAIMPQSTELPPLVVTITSPASQATVNRNGIVQFSAMVTPENAPATYTWTDDIAGFLGTGSALSYAFATAGAHHITCDATAEGYTPATQTWVDITVSTTDATPFGILITSPANNATFTTAQQVTFTANITDDAGRTLPNATVEWASNDASDPMPFSGRVAASAPFVHTFPTAGPRLMTVYGYNGDAMATAMPTLSITITAP